MVTTQDSSVGFGVESTPGTTVAPNRFPEFVSETFDWTKGTKQGSGLRVGRRVDRGDRRTNPTAQGAGDIVIEAQSKGLGLILQAMFGAATSTLVSAATYQQNFTLGDSPNSMTIQKGLVDSAGAVQAITFGGCKCDSFEFDFTNADIMQIKSSWDLMNVSSATAYTAPSYVVGSNLYQFANATIYSGTLTAATTTALASAATPLAYVRGGSVSVKNNLQNDRFNVGGGGRKATQLAGLREVTCKLDVELLGNTMINNVINDTPLTMVLNYTAGALGVGNETLQIVCPAMYADSELPKSNGNNLVIPGMSFSCLDDGTNGAISASLRTADTAL